MLEWLRGVAKAGSQNPLLRAIFAGVLGRNSKTQEWEFGRPGKQIAPLSARWVWKDGPQNGSALECPCQSNVRFASGAPQGQRTMSLHECGLARGGPQTPRNNMAIFCPGLACGTAHLSCFPHASTPCFHVLFQTRYCTHEVSR